MHDAGPIELWSRLRDWALRWRLSPPVLSAGWLCLPPSYEPAVVDGWVTRPLFEPPGDDAAVRALESESGFTLPVDLRALYAVHGGSYAPLLPYGMSLLPYEAMLTCWRFSAASAEEFLDASPQLSDDRTHYDWPLSWSWLPVAENDDSSIVLDFRPGPRGTLGQVLFPLDEVDRVVVAVSLTDLLRRWLAALDRGDVRFDPDYGYPVPVDREQRVRRHTPQHRRAGCVRRQLAKRTDQEHDGTRRPAPADGCASSARSSVRREPSPAQRATAAVRLTHAISGRSARSREPSRWGPRRCWIILRGRSSTSSSSPARRSTRHLTDAERGP